MGFFSRRASAEPLVVSMTGVKMGERMLQIGCAHGGRMAAVAAKVGLSGQAVVVVADDSSAARASKGAAEAGVLVDVKTAPPERLPVESGAFDFVVIDDTGGFAGSMTPETRVAMLREAFRALRPGGRVLVDRRRRARRLRRALHARAERTGLRRRRRARRRRIRASAAARGTRGTHVRRGHETALGSIRRQI